MATKLTDFSARVERAERRVRYNRAVQAGHPLATIFAASREGVEPGDDLEGALLRMLARGRAAWPALAVEDAAYVRYVAERTSRDAAPALDALFAEDLYIACACAAGDVRAITEFDRRYFTELAATLARSAARSSADEVIQLLRARLFVTDGSGRAKIAEYSGRGPLGGWLHVAAVRHSSNLRRSEATRAAVSRDAGSPAAMSAVDPEVATIQRRYGADFNGAFREAFSSLTAEERSALRLYFVDGLNIEQIGLAIGLSRATVGRRMVAARGRLLEETLRLLGERLRATPTELQSLLGVLRSKLEMSFGALIGVEPP